MKVSELNCVGEVLRNEFMEPNNLSAYFVAKSIGVSVSRIQDILHNRRAITVDTSVRLGKLFGVSSTYFIDTQSKIETKKYIENNKNILNLIKNFSK